MKRIAVLAALLAFATPAQAETVLTSCYAETSVAGTFLRAGDREAAIGIGGGCDIPLGDLTLGAGLRADLGDTKAGAFFAKLGYALNAHLTLYGLAAWHVPEFKIKDAGQLHLGAGAETSIQAVKGLSLFGEATIAADKTGAAARDDVIVRTGLRFRF